MATLELSEHVAQVVREILAEKEAMGDVLDCRTVREAQVRASRAQYLSALRADIGTTWTGVLKLQEQLQAARSRRAWLEAKASEWDGLSSSSRTQAERDAYATGRDWLRGVGGPFHETPGAVLMARRETPDRKVVPLPFVDGEIERLAADHTAAIARISLTLAGWRLSNAPVS
jgi:hypothetical protein